MKIKLKLPARKTNLKTEAISIHFSEGELPVFENVAVCQLIDTYKSISLLHFHINYLYRRMNPFMPKANSHIAEKNQLYIISEAKSGLTGHDLLPETARQIATHPGMKYCFIAECANENKTRLLSVVFVDGKNVLDNFEYNTNESGCLEGPDSKFIKANRAALKILALTADEVLTTYGKSLVPDTPDAQRRLKETFDSIGVVLIPVVWYCNWSNLPK